MPVSAASWPWKLVSAGMTMPTCRHFDAVAKRRCIVWLDLRDRSVRRSVTSPRFQEQGDHTPPQINQRDTIPCWMKTFGPVGVD